VSIPNSIIIKKKRIANRLENGIWDKIAGYITNVSSGPDKGILFIGIFVIALMYHITEYS